MNVQDHVHDAIDVVLAWDISDEALPEAVIAQASLMARVATDEVQEARYS